MSFLLVGCGSSTPTTATSTSPSAAPTTAQTQIPRTLTFKIAGIHDSSHGTLQVDIKATGYTMTATVEGLTPNSRHVIMIHAGTCARVEDMYYVPVDHVNADAKGTLTSVTTLPGLCTVPADGRIYCLHGHDRSIYEITDTTCAEMTA